MQEKSFKKYILVFILGFINALAIWCYTEMGDSTSLYIGTNYYGWNPACIAYFALDCILLNRFFEKSVTNDKKRIVISSIMGLAFSYLALWGTCVLYGDNTIFSTTAKTIAVILAPIGFSFITIPAFSEIVGFVNSFSKITFSREKKLDLFLSKHRGLYFLLMWAVFSIQFGILFLMFWPGVFQYDAAYQLTNYLTDSIKTHHPILSTLLIGKSYAYGMKIGDVNLGYSLYTLFQLIVLASSFAFFMFYVKCKEKRKFVRVIVFLFFFLNPVNSFFAISSVKGTLCAAFTIYALTFLLFFIASKKRVLTGILFVLTMIMSCHFRNNMIYAFVIAGLIIAILQKGIKQKVTIFILVICVFIGNKAFSKVLISATHAYSTDNYVESMSVPLQCLARVMINHADEIPDSDYAIMTHYILEEVLGGYSMFLADGIKNYVDPDNYKEGISILVKMWIKYGFKYPGEYIEQITALTCGYWYPLEIPVFLNGTTSLSSMSTANYEEQISNRDLTFFNGTLVEWFSNEDGRLRIPLFGWFWRGAPYFWSFIFAFFYSIYAKRKEILFVIIIPLLYMLTCCLGPVSWLRYIYINIACLPLLVYSLFAKTSSSQL